MNDKIEVLSIEKPKYRSNNNVDYNICNIKFKISNEKYVKGTMLVPKYITKEDVKKQLKSNLNSDFYSIKSNHPIIDLHEKNNIKKYPFLKEVILEEHVKRCEKSGKLKYDNNGKIFYERYFFTLKGKQDEDTRTITRNDYETTDSILDEMGYKIEPVKGQEI